MNLDPELAAAVPFLPSLPMGEPEEARASLRQMLAEYPRPPLPEGVTTVVYALRLLQAGVSVELHQFAGTFHGSTILPAAVSRRQQSEMVDALRRGLGL
jgi:hypothetical protein